MLIPQPAQRDGSKRQGGRVVSIDELRKSLTEPRRLTDWHRQRLLELVQRLDRVRALGDGFTGIELSPEAATALGMMKTKATS